MKESSEVSLSGRAAEAWLAFRDGDLGAMEHMIQLATPTLWHVVRSCGLTPAAAEDAIQTTWMRLVEKGDQIEHPEAVMSWLCVTARREAWRVSRLQQLEDAELHQEELPEVTPHDPAQLTALDERRRVLWTHFTHLTPRCQYLLRVVSAGDRPDYAALSQSLKMPIGSIGPTRGRCLAALRHALNNDPAWSI